MEALPRLIDPPAITNPKLILYVGCAGLASNFAGFFVLGGFHAGHSHGDEEEGHNHDELHAAEEGHSHHSTDNGNAWEVLPEVVVAEASEQDGTRDNFRRADQDDNTAVGSPPPQILAKQSPASRRSHHRSASSGNKTPYQGYDSISNRSLHPSRFREGIIAAANRFSSDGANSEEATESESEEAEVGAEANEQSPLIPKASESSTKAEAATFLKTRGRSHDHSHDHNHSHHNGFKSRHANHNHNKPREKKSGGHSHNHADMGMNAMILHVVGDALGNVGVILSALVIWLSDWDYKFYVDPFVSLFIAMIILKSCLPLSWASGKILCQATPDHIKLSEIKEDLQDIDGVVNCHHLHVWQLSDSTIIASLHLRVGFGRAVAKDEVSYMTKYMQTANEVQECLHGFGIHSATIQPEFCWDDEGDPSSTENGLILDGPLSRKATGISLGGDDCLFECVANCEADGCCVPTSTRVSRNASLHSHDHDSHDGHSH